MELVLLCVLSLLGAGKAYKVPYESIGGECLNSTTEYIPADSNLCCSKCQPGTRFLKVCSKESDTVCGPCGEGTYSEVLNYFSNCFSCRTCPESKRMQYRKTCTSSRDAECECKPGYYCRVLSGQQCSSCATLRKCPPGEGAMSPATPTKNIACAPCPSGTFSNESSSQICRPHTQCEANGWKELQPGSSTSDAVCMRPKSQPPKSQPPTTTLKPHTSSSTTPPVSSPETPTTSPPLSDCGISCTLKHKETDDSSIYWYVVGAVVSVMLLLVLLMVGFVLYQKKGVPKKRAKETKGTHEDPGLHNSKQESLFLLMDNKTEPATLSSSSSSSSSDSHSQSTGASQDSIHTDQPTMSSPCVNVSFTATFNCQMNPTTVSCVPITPLVQPRPVQTEPPLSQEEQLSVSCEEENSKDASQSVQESGKSVC